MKRLLAGIVHVIIMSAKGHREHVRFAIYR